MTLRVFEEYSEYSVQYFIFTFPEEVGPLAIIKLTVKGSIWEPVIEGFG